MDSTHVPILQMNKGMVRLSPLTNGASMEQTQAI